MKEIPIKTLGSEYSAQEFTEGVSQETQNFIRSTGRTLDEANEYQMVKSALDYASIWQYVDSGSTTDTYVVQSANGNFTSESKITSYEDGSVVAFYISSAILPNSGLAATLNVNNLGPKSIVGVDGNIPPTSSIVQFKWVLCVYDLSSDAFILMNPNATDVILRNILLPEQSVGIEGSRLIGHTGETVYDVLTRIPASTIYPVGALSCGGGGNPIPIISQFNIVSVTIDVSNRYTVTANFNISNESRGVILVSPNITNEGGTESTLTGGSRVVSDTQINVLIRQGNTTNAVDTGFSLVIY